MYIYSVIIHKTREKRAEPWWLCSTVRVGVIGTHSAVVTVVVATVALIAGAALVAGVALVAKAALVVAGAVIVAGAVVVAGAIIVAGGRHGGDAGGGYCVSQGALVAGGGRKRRRNENEPRLSSWFVFRTHCLGLPLHGSPLV